MGLTMVSGKTSFTILPMVNTVYMDEGTNVERVEGKMVVKDGGTYKHQTTDTASRW